MKEIAVGFTGINILFLISIFISLRYWNADWFKKLRKFYSQNFSFKRFCEIIYVYHREVVSPKKTCVNKRYAKTY